MEYENASKWKKTGRQKKPLENADDQTFRNRSDGIYQSIMEFLDQLESQGQDFPTFLAKLGRRAFIDPSSKHYDYEKGQKFNDIIKSFDVKYPSKVLMHSGK